MKLFKTLSKKNSKKIYLELINLNNHLDNLSIKSSFIYSRIDNLKETIHILEKEIEKNKMKLDLAIKKENKSLSKKALKSFLIKKYKLKFFKEQLEKSTKEKDRICKDLLLLQHYLDLGYSFSLSSLNKKAAETIKNFKNLESSFSEYLDIVEKESPEAILENKNLEFDLDIELYDYLEGSNEFSSLT